MKKNTNKEILNITSFGMKKIFSSILISFILIINLILPVSVFAAVILTTENLKPVSVTLKATGLGYNTLFNKIFCHISLTSNGTNKNTYNKTVSNLSPNSMGAISAEFTGLIPNEQYGGDVGCGGGLVSNKNFVTPKFNNIGNVTLTTTTLKSTSVSLAVTGFLPNTQIKIEVINGDKTPNYNKNETFTTDSQGGATTKSFIGLTPDGRYTGKLIAVAENFLVKDIMFVTPTSVTPTSVTPSFVTPTSTDNASTMGTAWKYEVKTLGTIRNNFKTLADCQADQTVFNKAKAYTMGDCTAYTLTTSSNDPILVNQKTNQDPAVPVTPKINVSENNSVYKMLVPIGNLNRMDSSGNPDCTEASGCITNNIGTYLNFIFKFAIGISAALAVIMLIINGITYMGDESIFKKTEAKSKMYSAILGLLIALGAWALLNTINPALTGKGGLNIDTANVEITPLYDRGYNDPKQANGESANCKVVPSGPCSVANLTTIFGAEKAVAMSKICSMESSGKENLASGTDYCKNSDGTKTPFSFGLFQVNLSANGSLASTNGLDCSGLFDRAVRGSDAIEPKYTSGYNCKLNPGKEALYSACKARLLDTTTNLLIAKSLFNNKSGMGNWTGDKMFCASAFK